MNYNINYILKDNYSELIKKEKYEIVLLQIINQSKHVFLEKYDYIETQSNGESDYIGQLTQRKMDAKILFETKICHLISQGGNKIVEWLGRIANLSGETYEVVKNHKELKRMKDTKLYIEFLDRISKINDDEDGLIFIPFCLTSNIEGSIVDYLSSDVFDIIFQNLVYFDLNKMLGKSIYIVYPTIENKVILRKAFDGKAIVHGKYEYIHTDLISNYYYVSGLNID